ncbi:MAG: hypothetical protein US52_C0001G0007 [candidate division WS6 bacterium GW2011_GWA2_37_6]|uniref:ATP-grasp domain-containing protein n=1 Tax=candidate division WS6 bacterium GW2011_GWA2_37_6 TaxID=1619087 RepID=A0A0G0JHT0_9BACT|nr:MAG: hypothetical protein US52_C0001G0007 [candidate division WS6 bacterium GW2011_GWA2_37_6]
MSDIDFYLKQVNYKLKETPLFYIANDAERALGLEGLLENFFIVCMDDSDIYSNIHTKYGNIFSLENKTGELNAVFRSSAKLLDSELVKEFIEQKSQGKKDRFFQTFKITTAFEQRAENYGVKVLNTTSELNKKFENKLSQYTTLSANDIAFPKTIIGKLSDYSFKKLKKQLGQKFVVQFNRGHTGSGTKMIDNESEYVELQNIFPERVARISTFVEGLAYTINACIGKNGIFIGGLNYQITGVEEIAPSKGATVGNDFNYRKLVDAEMKKQIIKEVTMIGEVMRGNGFVGLFGVDLIIGEDETLSIIEINARQPASIPFFTKLQLRNGQVPLSLIHLIEFLGIANHIDADKYSETNTEPFNAGQLFLRNIGTNPFVVNGQLKTGVYKITGNADNKCLNSIKMDDHTEKTLCYIKEGYTIEDIDEAGFLLITQLKGKRVNSGKELARIQSLQPLVDNMGKPFSWAIETLRTVKEYIN